MAQREGKRMTDYISRDTVIENILSLSTYDSIDEVKNKIKKARYKENEWIGGIHDALLACEEVPSADVREVVRGRWIRHVLKNANVPWGYDCSVCNKWYVINNDAIIGYNYCPNCGARMDGDAE